MNFLFLTFPLLKEKIEPLKNSEWEEIMRLKNEFKAFSTPSCNLSALH